MSQAQAPFYWDVKIFRTRLSFLAKSQWSIPCFWVPGFQKICGTCRERDWSCCSSSQRFPACRSRSLRLGWIWLEAGRIFLNTWVNGPIHLFASVGLGEPFLLGEGAELFGGTEIGVGSGDLGWVLENDRHVIIYNLKNKIASLFNR